MPRHMYKAQPKELQDGHHFLGCYASGQPFTLHLVWRTYDKNGYAVPSNRSVGKQEAQELLDQPDMKHLRDSGYQVEMHVYPVYRLRPERRDVRDFSKMPKTRSFYRQNFYPEGTIIGVEHRFYRINETQARYLKTQEIFDIPANEKVWTWT